MTLAAQPPLRVWNWGKKLSAHFQSLIYSVTVTYSWGLEELEFNASMEPMGVSQTMKVSSPMTYILNRVLIEAETTGSLCKPPEVAKVLSQEGKLSYKKFISQWYLITQ